MIQAFLMRPSGRAAGLRSTLMSCSVEAPSTRPGCRQTTLVQVLLLATMAMGSRGALALGPLGTRTSTTGRGKAKWGTGTLPRDRSRKQTGVDDSTIPVSVRAQEMENYELENSHQTQNQKKNQGLRWCGRVWFNSTWTLLYQLLSALLVFVMPSWAGVHVSCGCLPSQKHAKCKGTERGETPPSFHTLSLSHAFTSVWWSA